MTALGYKLPPQMDEFLQCSNCHNYLSVPPIVLLLTVPRQYKCGRCINEPKKVKYYRDVAYEYLANCFVFPCRFKEFGCEDQTPFGQVKNHENGCPYGKMKCPMKKCDELVSRVVVAEFAQHFRADHQFQEVEMKSHQQHHIKGRKEKIESKRNNTTRSVEFEITQSELLYFWISDEFYLLEINKADRMNIRLKSYPFSARMTEKTFKLKLIDDMSEFRGKIIDFHGDEPEESSGISFDDNCKDEHDCQLIVEMIDTEIQTANANKRNIASYEHNVALLREISSKYQYAVPSSIISTPELTCTKCKKCLSSRPTIIIASKNKLECGRCNDQEEDKLKLRPLAYEGLASTIVFPCSFAIYGCTNREHPIALRHHENSCKFSSVPCPLTGCTNKTKSMVGHFRHNHGQILVNLDDFKIRHNIWGLSPAITNNKAYVLDVQFKGKTGNGKCQFALTHVNRAAGPRESYKIRSKDSKVEKQGSIGQFFPKSGKRINASIVALEPEEIGMRDFQIVIDADG